MFDTLIESRPSPLGLPRWGVLGAVGVHVLAVSALLRAPAPAPVVPPIMVMDGFRTELTPQARGGGSEGPERLRIDVDLHLPPLPAPEPIPGVPDLSARTPTGPDRNLGVTSDFHRTADEAPVDVSLVQERPELLAAPQPVYPARLVEAGVEGLVMVQVVVDTTGRPESGSLRVVRSSNSGFDAAAAASIRGALFRPGRVWGRAVRVLVQVPVAFRLRP